MRLANFLKYYFWNPSIRNNCSSLMQDFYVYIRVSNILKTTTPASSTTTRATPSLTLLGTNP